MTRAGFHANPDNQPGAWMNRAGIPVDLMVATRNAIEQFDVLFAAGPSAQGSMMAGRAEEGIGDPANVSLSVSILASDVLAEVRGSANDGPE